MLARDFNRFDRRDGAGFLLSLVPRSVPNFKVS